MAFDFQYMRDQAILDLVASDFAYKPDSAIAVGTDKLQSYPDNTPTYERPFPAILISNMANGLTDRTHNQFVDSNNSIIEFVNWEVVHKFNRPGTGFGAVVFRSRFMDPITNKYDYIVAFRGTDGLNAQDWYANLDLAQQAWNDARTDVMDYLLGRSTQNPLDQSTLGNIHFTGQSLGGGLAQYAAYNYAQELKLREQQGGEGFDSSRVSLITFNAFAGVRGIQLLNGGAYDRTLLAGVETRHYVIDNDLVHRLGAGDSSQLSAIGGSWHVNGLVNGQSRIYQFDFFQKANGSPVVNQDGQILKLDIPSAHRTEAGFYAGFANFLNISFTQPSRQVLVDYIDSTTSQSLATAFSRIFNRGFTMEASAAARVLVGIAAASVAAPAEIDRVVGVVKGAYFASTVLEPWKTRAIDALALLLPRAIRAYVGNNAPSVIGIIIAAGITELGLNSAGEREWVRGAVNTFLPQDKQLGGASFVFSESVDEREQVLAGMLASVIAASQLDPVDLQGAFDDPVLLAAIEALSVAAVDADTLFSDIGSGDRWLQETLSHRQAGAAVSGVEGEDLIDFNLAVLGFIDDAIGTVGEGDPLFQTRVRYDLAQYFEQDFGWALANTKDDLIDTYQLAHESVFGTARLGFVDFDEIYDRLIIASHDPAYSAIHPIIDAALQPVEFAGQTIQISPAHPQNPFSVEGYDPDTAPTPSEEIDESAGQAFTVFLAYEAPEGGQQVRIKLEGAEANSLSVIASGPVAIVDGEFTLTIHENTREATFVLINDADVDADAAITMSATLVDETGTATHQAHLEANLSVDAQVEGPVLVDNEILGDQNPDSFSDTLIGTSGSDRMAGLAQNDRLNGDGGSDVLEGGADVNVLEGGGGADRLFAEDSFDLSVLTTYEGYGGEASSGMRGDWLNGQRDDDTLVGSSGNDDLIGGGGSDLLLAAAGDDFILSDHDRTAADFEWEHLPLPNPFDALTGLIVTNELYTAAGAADMIYAGAGNDSVGAGLGDDVVEGESGDDVLAGWEGDDILLGGTGNDKLAGEFYGDLPEDVFGADYLDGGDGNDDLYGEGGADVLFGGAGDDRLYGHSDLAGSSASQYDGADHIEGDAGNDLLRGDAGDDFLLGGADNDTVYGDAGADLVYGGTGNDVLVGDYSSLPGGMDTLDGGDGNDYIIAGMDADVLQGGLGADELQGGSASDDLAGGEGADRLFGDADDATPGTMGNDSLAGGAGDDQLVGGGGLDVLDGGDDNDSIFGDGDQIDAAYHGADTVLAGAGDDYVRTYGGDDLIFGEGGADQLVGEGGADSIDGGAGDDLLFGDADVTPTGEQGDDVMTGGEGNDQIVGYGGADTLDGGAGIDTLAGGMGGDVYLFGSDSGQSLIYDEGGDGLDAVLFSSDVRPDEITATRGTEFPNDLVLTIAGGAELTIANQFSMNTTFRMEEIRFSDGTVWTPTTVPLLVSGTSANNNLTGTAGPDVFEGLAGSDTLSGGLGNDTYRFRRGDGADTVVDIDSTPGNVDKVLFASDILPTDIRLSRSGDNLLLTLIGSTDRVTVTNYFVSDGVSANSVEQIKFLADGTAWDVAGVKLAVLSGTSSADTLTGYATHDVLSGFGGNDALVGNAGNDTLGGGSGNDIVVGGPGDDLYRFSRGHGADTISDGDATPGADRLVFASDIQPLDIVIARSFDDVVLSLPATGDQIRLAGYFDSSGATRYAIESIEFAADGTVWDVNAIKTFLITPTAGNDTIAGYPSDDFLAGLGGSDLITGMAGNDTFEGGTGFIDTLRGMTGNDTYLFFVGDETDFIDDIDPVPGNVDRLVFGPGILQSDIRATRDESSNALRLSVGTTGDHVTIASYFGIDDVNVTQLIEWIEFQDGTVWDASFVKALVNVPTAGNDNIVGYGTNDNLSGLEGDDGISGRSGNDTLDGGAGSDGLAGDGGSDTYLFGRNYGFEYINDWYSDSATTTDALVFAADVAPSQVTPTKYQDTALMLTIDGTGDQVFVTNYFVGSGYTLEQIRFADGTIWTEQIIAGFFPVSGTAGNDSLQGSGLSEVINGVGGNDTLRGGGGHDTINGGLGSDHLFGEDGNDRLIAGSGEANKASVSNHLRGGNGNDVLEASGKTDLLYGEAGNDILLGAGARDWLEDSGGSNLISGGATLDDIWMGDQNDLVIAGTGGDFVDGDRDADGIRGHDILAFNKSDGKDPVTRLGSGSTISIGGGTTYSNLSLVRQGTSLLVRTGSSHYMTLSNWYGSPAEKNVAVLQIVIEGTNNYNAGSSNPMNNRKIQAFDFLGLVAAFDAAGNPSNFNVANNLANFRLWGSDTDAIGGAIAYQYARTGSISSLTHDQMRAIVSDPAFGNSAQSITAPAGFSAMVEGGETAMQERAAAELSAGQALLDAPSTDASGARMPAQTTNHEVEITGSGLISHGSPSGITPGSGVTSDPGIGLGQGYDSGPSNVASAGAGASERIAAHEPSSGMQDIGWHRSSGEGRAPEEDVDAIAASWFTRRSLHEDLSLLDDIRRGEDAVELASSSSVAAAWEASHRWLSRPGGAAAESGGDDAGADLAGLSLFATGNTAYYDMPRAAVGLQEVSGHSLKSFRGLREGLSVLGQV